MAVMLPVAAAACGSVRARCCNCRWREVSASHHGEHENGDPTAHPDRKRSTSRKLAQRSGANL